MKQLDQRGIALLDALLAMLVIGIAVLSIAPMFAWVARSNAGSWQRTVAAELVQRKLEDLGGFVSLDVMGPGQFGYDEIGSNVGGTENAQAGLLLGAAAVSRDGRDYRLSWQVVDVDACSAEEILTAKICVENRRAAVKRIHLMVEWKDEWDEPQSLGLDSAVAAIEPMGSALSLLRRPHPLPPLQSIP